MSNLRFSDRILLGVALILGLTATLRCLGTEEITINAAGFLAAAALLSIRPLARLIKDTEGNGERRGMILAVIFGAHLIATLFFFPPEDIVNSRPVLSLDHALHYQQVVRGSEIFGDSYRLHTYDPYFMAGYPGGTVFDIDSKGVEIWCALLTFIDKARAYKIFILMGYLLLPFSMYAGSRRLGFRADESILSTLILMSFWHWGRPYVGEFRFAGMFSCLIVSHLSVYITGLFRSFLREEKAKAFWIAGPLAFLIHPTAAVLLPIPFISLFFVERRAVQAGAIHGRWELKILVRLVAWCLLILTVNAIWLVPFFRYLDIKVASETFFQINGIMGLCEILFRPGNLPALLLVALSITGLVHMLRNGRASETVGPAAGSAFLIFIAAFGICIPICDQMEPGRFLVPGLIFMAPLAGPGLIMIFRRAEKVLKARYQFRRASTAIIIVLLLSSPVYALLASRAWYSHTLSTTFTAETEDLIDALRRYTGQSGRLMIEDGPAWNYGDSFLPAIIPQITGVEQIGGPYPWAFIRHNFTNFHMCSAMGRPLKEMNADMLWRYISLYNIRWILTSTTECREYFENILQQDQIWSSKHFALWEVVSPGGSLEDRGIVIKASYGRIEVTLRPDENGSLPGRVLLPYHWDPGLHVDPPAVITREQRMEDPVPFIILEPHGKRDILIEYR